MGLLVWMPLNGSTYNQGASDIRVSGMNVSTNANGKIGSCYSFNGSSSYIKLDKSLLSNATTEFSFCCWAKFNNTTSGCLFSCRNATNNAGISIFVNNSGNILYDIGNERRTKAYSFTPNIWYYIAFTYKKGDTKKIYINGTLLDSVSSTGTMTQVSTTNAFVGASQSAASSVNANYLNGYLNDVRIYNHCLSAAEVHEISQGLVLHYKLDDITNGITDSSGYNRNGTMINTIATEDSTNGYYSKHIHISASNQHIQLPTISYSNFGNSFTIAWWGKRDTNSGKMFWGFSDGNRLNGLYQGYTWNTGDGSNNPIYQIGTTTNITSPTATDWHHYAMTGDGTSAYLYVDGVQYGKAKTYKGLTGTQIWINGWRNHTEYSSASLDMSDFRIYATALSANDIKTLYGARARIDNKKNMHAYEYNELKNVTNAQEYFTTTSADGTYYINQYRTPTTPAPSYKTNYINAYSRTCTSSLIPIEPENTYTLNYTNAEATTYTYTYASKVWKRKNGNQYTQVTTARYYGCAAGYKVELLLYDQSQELIKSKTISHETYGGVRTSNSYTSTSQTFSGGSYVFHLYDAELSSYDNVKYIGIITTVYGSNITSQGVFTISKAYSPSIKMYNTGIVNASLFNENEDIKFKPGASIETNNLIEM